MSNNQHKRGAPIGNTNALKTGFYARKLPAADVEELESYRFEGLSDEISLMRMLIRRSYEQSIENDDPRFTAAYLRIFSKALSTLARLLRIDQIVHPEQTLSEQVQQALASVVREMEEEKRLPQPAQPTLPTFTNPGYPVDTNPEQF